jgi:ferric-dicitrate binding protein FerR (iron transport regulator)
VTILPPSAAGDSKLVAGTVLACAADGRVSLRLADGASVRVDGGSRLRLASSRSLELQQGALYVDSGASPGEPLEIVTPLGRVTDVGTQFEVRLAGAGGTRRPQLRLRVREGQVRIDTGAAAHRAEAGSELLVGADGRVSRTAVAADDPGWHWAARAAPVLDIEGRSLASFLDWATRELGLRWRVVEPRPERSAGEIVLHGSVAGLTPEEAIEVVLTGSGLRARRAGGELLVSAAP